MGAVPRGDGEDGFDGPSPAACDAGGDGPTVDVGTACEMLGNRRRRFVIHHLKQQDDGVVEMGDLSTQVAAWERGIDAREVSYDERKTVHTALYQHHAPKLDEAGLVDYDSRAGVVELTEAGADVDLYLEAVVGRDVPWASYFLALSVVATLAAVAAWGGALGLESLPAGAGSVVLSAVFLASSAVFVYDNRRGMRLGTDGPPPEVDDA